MTNEECRAIFLLAGFEVLSLEQIPNQYWPECPNYEQIIKNNPWWIITTCHGKIKIGWRKRVISIDWSDCKKKVDHKLITVDEVTCYDGLIHAWSYGKAVEYLNQLRMEFKRL
jgi:hypothetical protein